MAFARVFKALRARTAGTYGRVIDPVINPRRTGTVAAVGGALGGGTVLLAGLRFATALSAPRTAPEMAAVPGMSAAGEVGVTQVGKIAYEFVGRIDQDGFNFVSYGYLTYVDGLPGSVLFADPVNHNEATARITYY